jgi:hypothetical protein
MVHTVGTFDPSSSCHVLSLWRTYLGHDIFAKLGIIHICHRASNQPLTSHTPMNSTAYTVPLDHFTGMTSNVVIVSDQLLVGSHTIIPLQLSSSTMVPQAMHVSLRSEAITQDPIGTLLSLRSNLSLPPRYNALNTYISNPA